MLKKEHIIIPVLILLLGIQLIPFAMTAWMGESIVLKVELYDPRDIFRGDYIALRFEEESVPVENVSLDLEQLEKIYDKKVYAIIKKQDESWTVVDIQLERPTQGMFIESRLDYLEYASGTDHSPSKKPILIHLDFGIDRFYVEENTGGSFEDAARDGNLLSELKVWKGDVVMMELMIED